jgi:hypothetical protein
MTKCSREQQTQHWLELPTHLNALRLLMNDVDQPSFTEVAVALPREHMGCLVELIDARNDGVPPQLSALQV